MRSRKGHSEKRRNASEVLGRSSRLLKWVRHVRALYSMIRRDEDYVIAEI